MSRGRKTVPEGKGPVPQEGPGTVDKSVVIEMFQKFKDINSRFNEMKKDFDELKKQANTSEERQDGFQQQLSRLALEKGEQGVKTSERGEHAVTDEGIRDTSSA